MELNLKGRKIVVTGAGEGIGRALALAFAGEGARVAACARGAKRLDALANEIEGSGHVFQTADLTKPEDIRTFYHKVHQAFGGIDVLVNNVGAILKIADFFELTDEDWQDSFDVNLMTVVRLTRLFISSLKNSGTPRIINISSIAAAKPGEVFPQYSAMKAALSNLTSSLAQTLAPDKILVNSVSPGPVWTRSWEDEAREAAEKSGADLPKTREELSARTAQNIPLKRMGMPEDITGLVLFLASDRASWITATDFTVDGGALHDPF